MTSSKTKDTTQNHVKPTPNQDAAKRINLVVYTPSTATDMPRFGNMPAPAGQNNPPHEGQEPPRRERGGYSPTDEDDKPSSDGNNPNSRRRPNGDKPEGLRDGRGSNMGAGIGRDRFRPIAMEAYETPVSIDKVIIFYKCKYPKAEMSDNTRGNRKRATFSFSDANGRYHISLFERDNKTQFILSKFGAMSKDAPSAKQETKQ